MSQIPEIVFNKPEEKIFSTAFSSIFSSEFLKDEINNIFPPNPNSDSKNNNFSFDKMSNIFDEASLSLIELEEEENENSIYFIKKQDSFETESSSTLNSTNSILDQEKITSKKKEDSNKKKINFITFLKKKRGKKSLLKKENSSKTHGSEDFDNIQRKIQVHFISFLISFANDLVIKFFGKKSKYHFKDVKYELKRIVNHKNVEYLKQCKYSDIVQMKISPKNKRFNEDTNKKIYLEITQLSKELKNFFDKNYLYIFQNYYLGLKANEKEINFEEIKMTLSPKTKGFYHLLEKNKFSKEKFINIIKSVYFTDVNYLNGKKFVSV